MPLRFSIRLLTMSMPTPRPEISVIVSAVLRPGCQMYGDELAIGELLGPRPG